MWNWKFTLIVVIQGGAGLPYLFRVFLEVCNARNKKNFGREDMRATRQVSFTSTKFFSRYPVSLGPLFIIRSCTTDKVTPFIEGTSDFAFKKLFHSKEVLIPVEDDAFQLDGNRAIEDLDFGDPHPGVPEKSKATTFDLFCKTTAGERIIIEMQRVTQLFFYKRALYDWALEVTRQDKPQSEKEVVAQRDSKNHKKGEVISKKVAWDYNFEPVYQFSVCDFPVFADDPKLKDAPLLRGLIHFNGNEPVLNYLAPLRLCFMQLPNFTLDNPRTSSPAEKIGTILKNLHTLSSVDELPEGLRRDPLVER